MENLRQEELLELIKLGENTHQDFKYVISDSRKIARSLSAFANTKGGSLLIGVKDNGRITGIKSDEEFYMAESAASLYSRPEISFETKVWRYEGKTVLEIRVPESKAKPHYVLEQDGERIAYFRHYDQNIKASEVQIKVWELQKQNSNRLLRYSDAEEKLFKLLNKQGCISLAEYKKSAKISHKIAVKTLANMIVIDLIRLEVIDQSVKYFLKNEKTDKC